MDALEDLELSEKTLELIRRYQGATPRYTSYPTADRFHTGFSGEDFLRHLKASNSLQIPAPLGLYLHVPFCHSLCYYCGCNKVVTQQAGRAGAYIRALSDEFDQFRPFLDPDREVDQIHFGGGTPNWLPSRQIGQIMTALERRFVLDTSLEREFSIEIDPRFSTPEDIHHLAALGFNRVSFGVQDTHPSVQQTINRICSIEQLDDLTAAARNSGIDSVSYDLIYGLPHQTRSSFEETIDQVIELRPDRISLFLYAHLPARFRAQRLLEDHRPDLRQRLQIYINTRRALLAAGFETIGMDHFALKEDRLSQARRQHRLKRNFQGYCTGQDRDLLGFGPSAISALDSCYAQNAVALKQWQSMVVSGPATVRGYALSQEDRVRREIIEKLMCYGEIDLSRLRKPDAPNGWPAGPVAGWQGLWQQAEPMLQQLADDGLVTLSPPRLRATALGQLLIRTVASAFDGFLSRTHADRFSHAV